MPAGKQIKNSWHFLHPFIFSYGVQLEEKYIGSTSARIKK